MGNRLAHVGLIVVGAMVAMVWGSRSGCAKKRTVRDVVRTIGPRAEKRLKPYFRRAGVPYPPARVVFLGLKQEKRLELWARGRRGGYRFVRSYPILAASGGAGPKLREGDLQVPEGFYRITWLHANSSYHLSMKINYPSAFDWKQARRDRRRRPGSNIFIHGKAVSIGCLALGDSAIEELFVMMARVGVRRSRVFLVPWDPRRRKLKAPKNAPSWVPDLYRRLARAFRRFTPKRPGAQKREVQVLRSDDR